MSVLWEHEAPEARGAKDHAELPFVSRFVSDALPEMKVLLDDAMKRCKNGVEAEETRTRPSSSTSSSQRFDDSQLSESSQSQNFCPTDSQYEDVFPTTPASVTASVGVSACLTASVTAKSTSSTPSTSTTPSKITTTPTISVTANRILINDPQLTPLRTSQPRHVQNLFGNNSTNNNINNNEPNIQTPSAASCSNVDPQIGGRISAADVDSLARLQLHLFSSYLNFMGQMSDNVSEEGSVGVGGGVCEGKDYVGKTDKRSVLTGTTTATTSNASKEVGEEKLYGDERIIRRLPKHVRSLNRHINRLFVNCRGGEGEGGEETPQMSPELIRELLSLDMMLGIDRISNE